MKEKNRGRKEERTVKVYDCLEGISPEWTGLKCFVEVRRSVTHKNRVSQEVSYFISSLPISTPASLFNEGIRSHWQIESFHYIKDVTFGEDKWKVKTKNAPANYSLIRNMVINIFRKNNLQSIQASIEKCSNNVAFMLSLL